MRTTVNLSDDVAAAVDKLRRARSIGVSDAINELARAGLTSGQKGRHRFQQRTDRIGLRIDVTNIAEAIETLEGPSAR